jgi:anti-sigma-K factor RskA
MSSDHERWDELAAGHALDALEPEETETFTAHLAECRRCQQAVDEHAFVAAQLGTLLSDDDEAPSWKQVRRGVLPEPPVSLDAERSRRQRSARLVAVAASVVVLLVTAIAVLLAADRSPSSQEQVLALCAASTSCHVVHLQGRADVVVTDASVRVLPKSLGEPPAGRVFVLWQLPRDGRPTMVGILQTTADGTVGESHPLALPYDSTAAFGVSSEPASVVPTAPTDVVVLGET